jgi:soluble lytic murein transglycosylase
MYKAFFRKAVLIIPAFMFICILPFICDVSDLKAAENPEVQQHALFNESDKEIKKASDLFNAKSYRKAEEILLDIVKNNSSERNKAVFLLGRLYMEEGSLEKAENYMVEAVNAYPLLRDYSLKMLTDIYMAAEKYEKAAGASRQINNSLLLQGARQSEIQALLFLKKDKEAKETLFRYVENYTFDWDRKLKLAMLMKDSGEIDKAVSLLKEIYINAVPLSNSALKELNKLKADTFLKGEILKRADNLFDKNNFQKAEIEYQKALMLADEFEKNKVIMDIGMCRFKLKQYTKSARTFEKVSTPEAMYWQAYSYYRMDNSELFEKVKQELARDHPGDERIALLLLMQAEDLRRQDKYTEAGNRFRKVLNSFPAKAEDALWGLGWNSYMSGDYKSAANYFSQLTAFEKSENYYKYIYWQARSSEKAAEECQKQKVSSQSHDKAVCDNEGRDFFSGLPSDLSFYGYLIKMRSSSHILSEKTEIPKPVKPHGEIYDRIEALALFGMRDEAVNEIIDLLKRNNDKNDFFYLGSKAMELGEYRKVIAFAEKATDREFFPYSFPLGFGDIITESAGLQNVDKYLVATVIREESRFDPKAVSWAGAMGLMQLMPATAYRLKKDLKLHLGERSEIHDVKKNIMLGTHYLSMLIREFRQIPFALAAYNAGENALKKWMAKYNDNDLVEFIENIPYKETRFYVKRVLKSYWRYRTINGLPVEASQIAAQGR